jgi:septal ring factor EnvC (AmiA/AmiB activator)
MRNELAQFKVNIGWTINLKNYTHSLNLVSNHQNLLDQVQAELEKEKEVLSDSDKRIAELQNTFKTKTAQSTEIQLEISKINHEIEKVQRDKEVAERTVLRLENEHEWILNQRRYVYFSRKFLSIILITLLL